MNSLRRLLLLLLLVTGFVAASAQGAHASPQTPAPAIATRPIAPYHLPPDKLQRAIDLHRQGAFLYFASPAADLIILVAVLALGVSTGLRNLTERISKRWWLQGFFFVPLLLAVVALLKLPVSAYAHHLGLQYGLSVQHWGSWLKDWAKGLCLNIAAAVLVSWFLYWRMRRSPRAWWFQLWLAALPFIVLGVFIAPVYLDPLFNRFEPLAQSNPALVQQLNKVVQRSGMEIPPERMFLMKASAKVTGLNAYVTGVGLSKRVVVWDTTIARATPDEILFIFGHETGHYVMQHLWWGMGFTAVVMLLLLPVAAWLYRTLTSRFGPRWSVVSTTDWAALPILLFVYVGLNFLAEPIGNTFSRHLESNADVYGQEAIHGIVTDPQYAAAHGFQILGETSLADPRPHPLLDFWRAGHPAIRDRVAFAATYDPWAPGQHPRYFPK